MMAVEMTLSGGIISILWIAYFVGWFLYSRAIIRHTGLAYKSYLVRGMVMVALLPTWLLVALGCLLMHVFEGTSIMRKIVCWIKWGGE
jgi:hypothetical protein